MPRTSLPWHGHINLTRPLALAPPPPIFDEVSATVLVGEKMYRTIGPLDPGNFGVSRNIYEIFYNPSHYFLHQLKAVYIFMLVQMSNVSKKVS